MNLTVVKKYGVTIGGSVVGALALGPIGLAIGLASGGAIDVVRARKKKASPTGAVTYVNLPSSVTGASGTPLPTGADKDAAQKTTSLLKSALAVPSTGMMTPKGLIPQAQGIAIMSAPAKTWLIKFQTSVGLPATGQLDPRSRAMLVLADPNAQTLPPVTPLG